jgi:tetratricopeptide (TPR) repeat protein
MESLDQPFAIQLSSHVFARTLPSAAVVYRGSSTEVQLVTRVNSTQTGSTAEGDVLFIRGGNHFRVAAPNPLQRLGILNELASEFWRQHRYDVAELLYRKLLQMQHELGLENEHAGTLDNLGMLLSERQRQGVAETYFWHALVIREKLLGPYHPDVARSLHNLAWQFTKGGFYSDAERLYRRALRIAENDTDHLALADLLSNLAWLYTRQGRFKEAEPLYTRSLSIKERQLGPTHPDVALALNNLAAVYNRQGRSKHAGQNLERALAICSKAEQTCPPSLLNSLAVLRLAQGRHDEALTLLRRTLKTARRTPGSELSAILLLNTIAEIYNAQGRLAGAKHFACIPRA